MYLGVREPRLLAFHRGAHWVVGDMFRLIMLHNVLERTLLRYDRGC